MNSTQSNNVIIVVLMATITILLFPFLQQISILTHLTPMYLVAFSCMCLLNPSFFRSKSFLWILIYLLVVFLNCITGDSYFSKVSNLWVEVVGLFIGLSFFDLAFRYRINLRYFLYTFCIFLFIGSLMTFYFARQGIYSYDIGANGGEELEAYMSKGMMDYAFPHLAPILIPSFVLGAKEKNNPAKLRLFFGGMILCVFVLVYSCQAFTPMVIALFTLIGSLVLNSNGLKDNLRKLSILLLIFLPLILSDDIQYVILGNLGSLFPSDGNYANKLADLQATVVFGNNQGGAFEGRTGLYQMTFESIANNLFFGTQTDNYSGHMALLDRVATLGVIGVFPLVYLIVSSVKNTLTTLSSKIQPYYMIGVISSMAIILTKNMIRPMTWILLFIYLPLMFSIVLPGETDNES